MYRQVCIILNDKKIALNSIVILAANPLYIMCTSRAIPDIWLCIFLTISALGMMRIIAEEGKHNISLLMIYLGAALAVASKGIPALALVAPVDFYDI